jgi:thymidylate synthase (FAD)
VKVRLLRITENPEELIASAARVCYASTPKGEDANAKLVGNLISWGHMSAIEHACATFEIDGISRACTHQLVRHRLASYNQQSQRYVKEDGFEYVTPESVRKDEKAKRVFEDAVEATRKAYKTLIDSGVPKEDARFILPNACATKIVVTMNFRELRHFIKLRGAKDAQWEIREVALRMLEILKEKAPNVFHDM